MLWVPEKNKRFLCSKISLYVHSVWQELLIFVAGKVGVPTNPGGREGSHQTVQLIWAIAGRTNYKTRFLSM